MILFKFLIASLLRINFLFASSVPCSCLFFNTAPTKRHCHRSQSPAMFMKVNYSYFVIRVSSYIEISLSCNQTSTKYFSHVYTVFFSINSQALLLDLILGILLLSKTFSSSNLHSIFTVTLMQIILSFTISFISKGEVIWKFQ